MQLYYSSTVSHVFRLVFGVQNKQQQQTQHPHWHWPAPPPIFRCSVHRIPYSVCLLCSTAVVLYGSTNNVFFLWSLQHSDLGWSVCLPTTLCCLLVCHCMFRAERDDVDVRLEQVRRGCMVSAGRSVFALCILVPFGGSGKCFLRAKWPVEGSHFPTQQGTCPKSGCSSVEK